MLRTLNLSLPAEPRHRWLMLALIALLLLANESAFAAATGGSVWAAPLQYITDALTGEWAYALSLAMVLVALAGLAFGGDFSGFGRFLFITVGVIGVLVAIPSFLTALFPGAAAVI